MSESPPLVNIGGHIEVRYVPKDMGVGRVSWWVYGPFVWLNDQTTGSIMLQPAQALELAEWIQAHRDEIMALDEPPRAEEGT